MFPALPDPPFSYPRAGVAGSPDAASLVEGLLIGLIERGLPPQVIGPTLVQGYVRLYRRLPTASAVADKSQVPLLYSLLGSGPGPLKMAKLDAAYQEVPVSEQRCANCSSSYTHNVSNDRICSQVEGTIKPDAWCRLWNTDRL